MKTYANAHQLGKWPLNQKAALRFVGCGAGQSRLEPRRHWPGSVIPARLRPWFSTPCASLPVRHFSATFLDHFNTNREARSGRKRRYQNSPFFSGGIYDKRREGGRLNVIAEMTALNNQGSNSAAAALSPRFQKTPDSSHRVLPGPLLPRQSAGLFETHRRAWV